MTSSTGGSADRIHAYVVVSRIGRRCQTVIYTMHGISEICCCCFYDLQNENRPSRRATPIGNPLKLRVAVWVVGGPFGDFPVGLKAIPSLSQQFANFVGTDHMAMRADAANF